MKYTVQIIGQRLAQLVVSKFDQCMEDVEVPIWEATLSSRTGQCSAYNARDALTRGPDGWTDACRFIARRRSLSTATGNNELKAYQLKIYTDDAKIDALGAPRMLRALRCWKQTTDGFGLEMAGPAKRQVGTSVTSLGFNFYPSLGIVAVTPEKVARASAVVCDIVSGAVVRFDEYRRLLGLLEHMLVLVGGDRTFMNHAYGGCFRRGLRFGPATRMVFSSLQSDTFRRWSRTLLVHAGSFFSAALAPAAGVAAPPFPRDALGECPLLSWQQAPPDPDFFLFSDAAAESGFAGIGGWSHGEWWHLQLPAAEAALFHITALEMLAAGVNVVLYGDRLRGYPVRLCSDALATVQILQSKAAHSPTLQAVHEVILSLPEFASLEPTLQVDHVYGEANVMADASSRAKIDLIAAVARQMGVPHRHVGLPDRATDFVGACMRRVAALGEAAAGEPVFRQAAGN